MTTTEDFYSQIYNLSHIQRYSTIPRIKSESVAEHSFFVAALVIRLHKDYEFDLGRAVTMAVMHDWTESWIDDITVPTKKEFPALAEAISQAEAEVAAREFPQPILEIWEEHKECMTVESKIVHLADILQCMQYSKGEVRLGNNGYMQKVYDETIQRSTKLFSELKIYER
jgi:5'-deoxynucleotidase YfbR-like HD superfamily hydrolase